MRQRRLKSEINVVPYIDVMLVLLVIFMVTTPMMTTGSVDLPTSGTAPKKPDSYVKVEIKKDGAFSIYSPNGKEKKLSSLKELKSVRGPLGLRVERDLYFRPQPLSRIKSGQR